MLFTNCLQLTINCSLLNATVEPVTYVLEAQVESATEIEISAVAQRQAISEVH